MKTIICVFLLLQIYMLIYCNAASTKGHVHSTSKENKERVSDGAYIPKDAHHMEGGEHHSEFDHEAILGSIKEADEFHKLSPAESKRRLAILVTKMDSNSDRFVDRHELKAWILRSFKMLSEEEAAERFEEVDVNSDNIVSFDEYVDETYNLDDGDYLSRESDESQQQLIADDKIFFDVADENKDNVLNFDEFVVFTNPEEHPSMLPVILEQTLKEKDLNKDGHIDFQEYIGDKVAHHDKSWLIVEKQKFDEELDKNSDGILSGNEILSWVVPSDEETAVEEVDHLFASSDDDHDDRLSYEEILLHHSIFVGSEATDYGDHLHNNHFLDEL